MNSLFISPASPWPLEGRTMPSSFCIPVPSTWLGPSFLLIKSEWCPAFLLQTSWPFLYLVNIENEFLLQGLLLVVLSVGIPPTPDLSTDSYLSFGLSSDGTHSLKPLLIPKSKWPLTTSTHLTLVYHLGFCFFWGVIPVSGFPIEIFDYVFMTCLSQWGCNLLEKSYLLCLLQLCVTSMSLTEGAQEVVVAWMNAGNLRSPSSPPCPFLSLPLSCFVLSLPWTCSWLTVISDRAAQLCEVALEELQTHISDWAGVFPSGTQMGCVICRLFQSYTHDTRLLSAR